jgi:WD40 repeat protein
MKSTWLLLSLSLLLVSGSRCAAQWLKKRLVVPAHEEGVYSLAFSPDGKTLATGSRIYNQRMSQATGVLKLWDVETGKQRKALTGHTEGIGKLAFSPDGKNLATAASDYTIKWWDLKTGKVLRSFSNADNYFRCLAFSPDGKTLGYVGDSKVELLDATTGKKITSFERLITNVPAALSRDLKMVATAYHQDADLYNTRTGKLIRSFEDHRGGVVALAFSDDGKTLAVASTRSVWPREFGEIKLWDLATGRERAVFKDLINDVDDLAFSPDGKLLAVAGSKEVRGQNEVKLIDATTGRERAKITIPKWDQVYNLVFSPDGRLLAGITGKTATLWEVQPAPGGRK